MSCQPDLLALTLPGAPDSIGEIRTAVCEFAHSCGFPEEKVEAIRLAVSEAATNAVIHGYKKDTGQIEVSAGFDEGILRIVIADRGRGMLPHHDSDGLGLGVPLMSTLSDHLDIASPINEVGTEVHLYFRAS